MSDPMLELLAAPPSPPMSVDEDAVRLGGRRRLRRRRTLQYAAAAITVCALGGVGWVALPTAQSSLTSPAAGPPSTSATGAPSSGSVLTSSLDAAVGRVATSPTAVMLTLSDGAHVWVDPGPVSKAGDMRLAARLADGTPLGVASKAGVPLGRPYNVRVDWSRALLPDRLLVWGVDLKGSTNLKVDLAPGFKVVSTRSANVPSAAVMVWVIEVRNNQGKAPTSLNEVTGFSARTPATWPPSS